MRADGISNEQVRKLALPLGAGVIAAAGTMFVPTAFLEMLTGATGLSELVPATAAPLGDTARALIAFGAGAFTLAMASMVAFRSDGAEPAAAKPIQDGQDDMQYKTAASAKPSLADRIGSFRMPQIKLPKMPWIKGEGDVTELSDLPRLRTADAHPDAPSRRPLSASADLPTFELTAAQAEPQSLPLPSVAQPSEPDIDPAKWYGSIAAQSAPAPTAPVEVAVAVEAPIAAPAPWAEVQAAPEPIAVPEPVMMPVEAPMALAPVATTESLDDMLAQFEASIARREAQLASRPVEVQPVAEVQPEPAAETEILPPVAAAPEAPRFAVPPLSAVESTGSKAQEEMDSALAAALATLNRMNGTSR